MQPSAGYCSIELVGSEEYLVVGHTYTFQARVSKDPPPFYADDPVLVEALPERPGACVLCPGLRQVEGAANRYVPMVFAGDGQTATASFELRAEEAGETLLFAQFYDGRELLRTLQLGIEIRDSESSPEN
jgi:hypothetical protein